MTTAVAADVDRAGTGADPADLLPVELWHKILNGCDDRKGLLFLDPRFRFAARATCALWRAILERSGPDFAAALNAPPWRCQTARPWPLHPWYRALMDGRAVCLSALVTMIAHGAGGWHADPETFVGWFSTHVPRAHRHHAALVMLMSPAAHVVEYVCEVRARDADSATEGRLFDVLACGLKRLTRGPTYRSLQARLYNWSRITVAVGRLVDSAIEKEHDGLLRQIIQAQDGIVHRRHWKMALRASGPACLDCIADCEPRYDISQITEERLASKTIAGAVKYGRHWVLDRMRAKCSAFKPSDVFAEAMAQGAVSTLDWVRAHFKKWLLQSIAGLTVTAVNKMSRAAADAENKAERSFGWICDHMRSAFGPADRGALFNAIVAGRHFRLLLFLLDRHFFRVNAKVMARAFALCLAERDHLRSACALLKAADAYFPSDVDLWHRVIVPAMYEKGNVRANCLARVLCAVALGVRADRGDVYILDGTREKSVWCADGQCWCDPQTEMAASLAEQLLRWCRPVARFDNMGAGRLYDRTRLPTRTYMALRRLAMNNSAYPSRPDPRDPDPPLFY
ncbi:F-box domain-containing protein [Pandoravirus kuranda]|uniref:F-box domain-containing protein n=2 Tax=Pandoravirus TaxID=2060084 RepID=A0AA95EE96_9VIRU|nr:F-box domain containing protein [Pandoravirus neocaledonia]AVK76340.1 F-box domain containing protein [Pandoravirus neocaledonia]WBR14854.1 F-box domain-containing protein [Pandoravirus kuranda]